MVFMISFSFSIRRFLEKMKKNVVKGKKGENRKITTKWEVKNIDSRKYDIIAFLEYE